MFIFEQFKQLIWPNIFFWQSYTVTILFTALLSSIAVYFSLRWLKQEQARQQAAIEAQRLPVLKATMTTVNDIVNNFLQNVQLLILKQEKGEILTVEEQNNLNAAVQDTFTKLKRIDDLDKVSEKTVGGGAIGIDYDILESQSDKRTQST